MTRSIEIVSDPQQLAHRAAELWCSWANDPTVEHRDYHVALSGGTTPKRLYSRLGEPPFLHEMPWRRLRLYFGDERFVPRDHEDSNFRMVNAALLDRIRFENVYPVDTNAPTPQEAALRYGAILNQHLPKVGGRNQFDLILLGMGNDGHTASLFPETTALEEKQLDVAANYVDKLNSWRITLTYPAINTARRIMILIEGETKAEMVKQVLDESNLRYPIQFVRGQIETIWLLDKAAARLLDA